MAPIEILVRTIDGRSNHFRFPAAANDDLDANNDSERSGANGSVTVADLRQRVAEFWNYDLNSIRVLYNGSPVDNNYTFTENATVNVVLSRIPENVINSNNEDSNSNATNPGTSTSFSQMTPQNLDMDRSRSAQAMADSLANTINAGLRSFVGQGHEFTTTNDANISSNSSNRSNAINNSNDDVVMVHSVLLDYGDLPTNNANMNNNSNVVNSGDNALGSSNVQVLTSTLNNIIQNTMNNNQRNRFQRMSAPSMQPSNFLGNASSAAENINNSSNEAQITAMLSVLFSHLNYLNSQDNFASQMINAQNNTSSRNANNPQSSTESSNSINNPNDATRNRQNSQLYQPSIRRFIEMFVTLSNHLSRAAVHSQDFAHRLQRVLINNTSDYTTEFNLNYSEAIFSILHALSHALHNFSSFNLYNNNENQLSIRRLSSDEYINQQTNLALTQGTAALHNQTQPPVVGGIYRMQIDTNLPCNSRHYVSQETSAFQANLPRNNPASSSNDSHSHPVNDPNISSAQRPSQTARSTANDIRRTIRPTGDPIRIESISGLQQDPVQFSTSVHLLFVSIIEDLMHPENSGSTIQTALTRLSSTLNILLRPLLNLNLTDGHFVHLLLGYFDYLHSEANVLFTECQNAFRDTIFTDDPISHIRRSILRSNNLISPQVVNAVDALKQVLSHTNLDDPNHFLKTYRDALIAIHSDNNCIPLVHSTEYDRGMRKIKELIRMAKISSSNTPDANVEAQAAATTLQRQSAISETSTGRVQLNQNTTSSNAQGVIVGMTPPQQSLGNTVERNPRILASVTPTIVIPAEAEQQSPTQTNPTARVQANQSTIQVAGPAVTAIATTRPHSSTNRSETSAASVPNPAPQQPSPSLARPTIRVHVNQGNGPNFRRVVNPRTTPRQRSSASRSEASQNTPVSIGPAAAALSAYANASSGQGIISNDFMRSIAAFLPNVQASSGSSSDSSRNSTANSEPVIVHPNFSSASLNDVPTNAPSTGNSSSRRRARSIVANVAPNNNSTSRSRQRSASSATSTRQPLDPVQESHQETNRQDEPARGIANNASTASNSSTPSTFSATRTLPSSTVQPSAANENNRSSTSTDDQEEIQTEDRNSQIPNSSEDNERTINEHFRRFAGAEHMPQSFAFQRFNNSAKVAKPIITESMDNPLQELMNVSVSEIEDSTLPADERSDILKDLTGNEDMRSMLRDMIHDRAIVDTNYSSERYGNISKLLE